MKSKDLLDIFGDIDQELVEDAAPADRTADSVTSKNKTFVWIKPLTLVACLAFVMTCAIIAKPIVDRYDSRDFINTDHRNESEVHTNDGIKGDVNDTTIGDDEMVPPNDVNQGINDFPECDETEGIGEEVPYIFYTGTTSDERLSNFDFIYMTCSFDKVGEKIGETVVVFCDENGVKYDVMAEINERVDVDGDIALCIRYIKEDKNASINDHIDYDNYWLLIARSNTYSSFAELREGYFGGAITDMNSRPFYYKDTEDIYCPNFKVSDEVKGLLVEMLNNIDGEAVDGVSIAQIEENCNETLSLYYLHSPLKDYVGGTICIYDTGYLYFMPFGGRLYYIGEEATRDLIDTVLQKGDPVRFVWNEQEGKWYPETVNNYQSGKTLQETFELNGLIGSLRFENRVDYFESYIGFSPRSLTLDDNLLYSIADVLYVADGEELPIYSENEAMRREYVGFTHCDDYGSKLQVTVYSNGYVLLGTSIYDVGVEITGKIISVVKTDGEAPEDMFWNENEQCWQTYCPEDEEHVENDTVNSENYGYGVDIPEDSVDYSCDTDIYEGEETLFESETCIESFIE